MECKECKELFSAYYDGELRGEDEAPFIEHLRSCPECKKEFARYSEALKDLRSVADEFDAQMVAASVRKAISQETGRAARWRRIVTGDMKVISEMLRPARGGLFIVATVAAAALFIIVLAYALTSGPVQTEPKVQPEKVAEETVEPARTDKPIYTSKAAQGDWVRLEGEWMTKEDALAKLLGEKGYKEHEGWFLPEEDATSLQMGLFRKDDSWLTEEELARRVESERPVPEKPLAKAPVEEPKQPDTPEETTKQPEEQLAEEPAPKTEPVLPTNEVASFLANVLPDEVRSHESLTVYSLVRQEQAWPGKDAFYVTLAEAVERGIASIHETGTVSRLLVKKEPGVAVFMPGGGIVIGGWQNRLVGPDIVLSTDSTEAHVSVYCAEQGRWEGEKTFKVAGYFAPASLRVKSYNGEEQDMVWKTIKELRKSQRVYSTSRSLTKLYEKRSTEKKIAEFEEALSGWKGELQNKPHTVGFAVMVDGRVIGADLFINNQLLLEHFDQLVRTYAVEAVIGAVEDAERPAEPELRRQVGEFVASAARSTYNSSGDQSYLEYRITSIQDDLFGYALSTSGVPVHVSLFADGTGLRQDKPVARPPLPVLKEKPAEPAGDASSGQKQKQPTLEEAAAAKLRKEGKLKPRVPLPPSPPAPQVPKVGPNKVIAPRIPGR